MSNEKPIAPRFHAYWEHLLDERRILIMRKRDWDALYIKNGELITLERVNHRSFPLEGIFNKPNFLAARAFKTGQCVEIVIYRGDPKDEPKPINVDIYDVYIGLPPHINKENMITTSSTGYNLNFMEYESEYVFFVKRDYTGPDHHLSDLPSDVKALIRQI